MIAPDATGLQRRQWDVRLTRRFLTAYGQLPRHVAGKARRAIHRAVEYGPRHRSLRTHKIEAQTDGRFHLMDADDQYRLVVALEGDGVFFDFVGNHDEAIAYGEAGNLREYERRLAIDPEAFIREPDGHVASISAKQEELFASQPASLQQIFQDHERLSDLITADVFGALEGFRDGTIEDWMIFLSPLQHRAVHRTLNGPARVTGGPGTGKTVVALHRAAGFVEPDARGREVLMTSYIKTIPRTLDHLMFRLAPNKHRHVAFQHIHEIAANVLRERDIEVSRQHGVDERLFDQALRSDENRLQSLRSAGIDRGYAWEEVTRVIEGRGVLTVEDYVKLKRHGRVKGLTEPQKRALWQVFIEYRAACDSAAPRVADAERLIQLALEAVRAVPLGRRYKAIVVDEAQDITEVGIRFLTELVEGGPSGRILIVGDQSQRIFPGGFSLSDAGLNTTGRSISLRESYRSTDEIMQAVGALGKALSQGDFGDDGLLSLGTSTTRTGERPTLRSFASEAEERDYWVRALHRARDIDSVAVLLPTGSVVTRWSKALDEGGVPYVELAAFDGKPARGVKVGTYARAKGLEFKHVILPNLDDGFPWATQQEVDRYLEQGSMLYVAMSRARDGLHLSHAGSRSYLLGEFASYCRAPDRRAAP